ncbi:MAG: hypothetical protein KAS71_05565 [Bacteroidales bacterium]|nr:hypothetical protein [Bacteroidales bacterium]
MNELKIYLKSTLGIEPEIQPLKTDKLKALPLYITGEYTVQRITLFHRDFLLVGVKNDFTTDRLRKHLETIRAAFNTNTIAVITKLEAYKRLRLIEKKIPFIIPGKQMYLPDLLIDLKEFGNKPKELPAAMRPATQFLLMYHLQVEPLEGINLKGIAEKLGYDAATITRAVYYLHNTDICTLEGAKDKTLHFNKSKRELWEQVELLMNNPVKKIHYYSGWVADNNMYRSNNNALAHYSDLNDDVIEYYAVKPGYTRIIGGANLKKTALLEGNICIEEWKYNPFLLAKNGFVDSLSLYLCFRNKPDERIEMALEQIIENIKW